MRYGLNAQNKGVVDNALDFPRLKLKKGEVARIAVVAFPKGEDGKIRPAVPDVDGGYYFGLEGIDAASGERKFYGSFECLAPEDVKMAGGLDADACPHCRLVPKIPDTIMRERKRRHVVPVIRYKTKPKTSTLQEPLSVEVLAWSFTDRYFNVLVDENEKWAEGGVPGLLAHDISLVCEVENFQTFKMSVEPTAAWRASAEASKLVVATFLSSLESVPDGLGRILGTRLEAASLEAKIMSAYNDTAQAGGLSTAEDVPSVDPATIASLADDLLKDIEIGVPAAAAAPEPTAEAPTIPPVVAPAVDVEPGAGNEGDVPPAPAQPAPAAAPAEDPIDFDSFWKGGTEG